MLRYLIQKEFLQIRRNSFLPKLIIMFPIMIMCVMPWVMNQEVKNVRATVVDNDHSTLSRQLVHRIEASNYFRFSGLQPTYSAALQAVETSRADIILVIPPDYERSLTLHHPAPVLIAANAVNGTKGGIGAAYLSQIVNEELRIKNEESSFALNEELREKNEEYKLPVSSESNSYSSFRAEGAILHSSFQGEADHSSFFIPHSSFLYNPHQNYKVFMIPALLAIVMMLICGFLPALNIVSEKESGTIEQINVTPVSKGAFILAKLIPYWLIALFIITVCLLLLSGLFTPTRSMPAWSYATTYVNPMHYFIDAIRSSTASPARDRSISSMCWRCCSPSSSPPSASSSPTTATPSSKPSSSCGSLSSACCCSAASSPPRAPCPHGPTPPLTSTPCTTSSMPSAPSSSVAAPSAA